MVHVPANAYLILAIALFAIGLIGVVTRRNMIITLMSLELMLNAANIVFITFARLQNSIDGQVIVFFVMALAAAEAAVGLSLTIAFFKKTGNINLDKANKMKH